MRLVIFIVLATVCGCSGPQNQTQEVPSTAAERVANISRLIESSAKLPSDMIDARMKEVQLGDGQMGPSDNRWFVWIKVSAEDVEKWKSMLKTPPENPPEYDAPSTKPKWWISNISYNKLIKYDSHALFDRPGWIAIEDDGNIFALTFSQ